MAYGLDGEGLRSDSAVGKEMGIGAEQARRLQANGRTAVRSYMQDEYNPTSRMRNARKPGKNAEQDDQDV